MSQPQPPIDVDERVERQQALLQALLGQIDLLIAPKDEPTLLEGVCTHLLSSGLFIAAWVAQSEPRDDALKLLAAGADTARHLYALDEPIRAALFAQVTQAQLKDLTLAEHAEESFLLAPWLPLTPGGQSASQIHVPLHRAGRPWAVMSVVAVQDAALEPFIIDTLCHLGELISNTLDQMDLRERLTAEHERAAYLAFHDALTGLANRRFLDDELPKAMGRARRNSTLLAVVMLDLDDFKPINDRWGHAAGDALLQTLAKRLQETLREGDLAVRQGGDEFILLIEGIERKKHLSKLLDRLAEVISEPFPLQKQIVRMRMSMGITLFPTDDAEPEQLLRHADAALYVSKGRKQNRKAPWCFWNEQTGEVLQEEPETTRIQPYGHAAAVLLQSFKDDVPALVASFVDFFYRELIATDPASVAIVHWLSPEEYAHLQSRQSQHLVELLDPELTEAVHRASARRVGSVHALIGVSASSLVRAITIYLHQFDDLLARFRLSMQELNKLELVLTERLSIELAEELEAENETNEQFQKILLDIETLSHSGASWAEFNERLLALLSQCPGVVGGWIGAPGADGVFVVNFNHGMDRLIDAMQARFGASKLPRIEENKRQVHGATARAFQFGKIATIPSYSTSIEGEPWREVMALAGIRSSAALPIVDVARIPKAVLSLYGGFPGMFETPFRQAFCQQIAALVSQAWQQLRQNAPVNVSVQEVHTWRQAFYNHGIFFDYQPIFNLRNGTLEKVEALARLRLDEGVIVPPGAFIPRLNEEQVVQLFRQGLETVLRQLLTWDAASAHRVGVSLNLPLEALADPHCAEWVERALSQHRVAPQRLTLEVLEHHEIHALDLASLPMRQLARLGVNLSMDDLGSGYSGLTRLNNLPFDTVKIDQGLIRSIYDDPVRITKFISALIHMTRALDLQVVAEGLETPDLIEALQILGADRGQGFGLARPLPPEAILPLLSQAPQHLPNAVPRTPLGAIAAHWLMASSLTHPPLAEPDDAHATSAVERCPVHHFIQNSGLAGSTLDQTNRALHDFETAGQCHTTGFQQQLIAVQQQLARLVHPPEFDADA